jgi:hypothetical protein
MSVFYVYGNWGTLECALDTGVVQRYCPNDDGEWFDIFDMAAHSHLDGYYHIIACDIAEYRNTYPNEDISHIDILDIGTWDLSDNYVPAAEDFRREARSILLN